MGVIEMRGRKSGPVMKGPPMPYATWESRKVVSYDAVVACSSRAGAHREIGAVADEIVKQINLMLPDPFIVQISPEPDNSKACGKIGVRILIPTTRGQNLRFKLLSMIPFFGKLFTGPKVHSRIGGVK